MVYETDNVSPFRVPCQRVKSSTRLVADGWWQTGGGRQVVACPTNTLPPSYAPLRSAPGGRYLIEVVDKHSGDPPAILTIPLHPHVRVPHNIHCVRDNRPSSLSQKLDIHGNNINNALFPRKHSPIHAGHERHLAPKR